MYIINQPPVLLSEFNMKAAPGVGQKQNASAIASESQNSKDIPIKRQIIPISSSSLSTIELVADSVLLKKPSKVKQLLKKPDFRAVFSESDRVHITKMVANFSGDLPEGSEKALIQWLKNVKEELGETTFLFISNPNSYINTTIQEAIKLLQKLIEMSADLDQADHVLTQFFEQKKELVALLKDLDALKNKIDERKYYNKSLEEVVEAFSGRSVGSVVNFPLPSQELQNIVKDYQRIEEISEEIEGHSIHQLIQLTRQIQIHCKKQPMSNHDLLTLIAIGRKAIQSKFGILPYSTQIFAILALLKYPSNLKGRLAQIIAGEGKSAVITLMAFVLACQSWTVDIVSSSNELAIRDQQEFEDFFREFSIPTSHLCTPNPTSDNFKGQIIYGTNTDFEFAFMREALGLNQLRTYLRDGQRISRPFEKILVDEADNYFIDTARNSARIAIPGRSEQNWIYKPILSFVKDNLELVRMSLKADTASLIKQNLIQALQNELSCFQNGKFKDVAQSFDQEKLETWLESAYCALYEKKNTVDYVIKPVETWTSKGKVFQKKVVIVDQKITGEHQEGSRWQNGLHEFLEAIHEKEGVQIEEENLMPASICHPIYFKKYQSIYGLTGTVGTEIEREELKEIYEIDTFDVPTHRVNDLQILPPKILFSRKEHLQAILDDIQDMQKQNRPALILLETIRDTESFVAFLKEQGLHAQLFNGCQAAEGTYVISQIGAPRCITVATNKAGRGLNAILHPSSLASGGLHVVFGFLPENERVLNQGFKRAGRQGQPGSARFIGLLLTDINLSSSQALALIKALRDERVKIGSKERRMRFGIEQINYRYLEDFFKLSHHWQKTLSADFLNEVAINLQEFLKSSKLEIPTTSLDPIGLKLRHTFQYQASSPNSSLISWIPYLEAVKKILGARIHQNWAEFFYEKLDALYYALRKESNLQDKDFEAVYQARIDLLYQSVCQSWLRDLEDPKASFIDYLNKIINNKKRQVSFTHN